MPAGRPTKYREEMCSEVVELGKEGKGLAEIASALGVCRDTVWDWTNEKPEFCDAIKKARDESMAWWERRGREATFGGVEGFNATSWIFNMKNRFRKDWNDKVEHEHTGEIEVIIGKST